MPGADVPVAGEIGRDDVDNAEQEANFEALAEAVRRTVGVGSGSLSPVEISAGAIAPTLGLIPIATEGGVSSDNLDQIDPGAYLEGSIIVLFRGTLNSVVVRHAQGGSGQIFLSGNANFTISTIFESITLRLSAGIWFEMSREYGSDSAAARAFLGLGTAALLDNGALNAATLGGLSSSAFLLAAGVAVNSAQLNGLSSSAFLGTDLASLRTIAGSFQANGAFIVSNSQNPAVSSVFDLRVENIPRARMFFEPVAEEFILRVFEDDGSTLAGGIRIRDGEIPEYWDKTEGVWTTLFSLSPPFPQLGRIRWDMTGPEVRYSDPGRTVLHSAPITLLPGSGATQIFQIDAGIRGSQVGGTIPAYLLEVYIGPNGDQTDTLVAISEENETPGNNIDVLIDRAECEGVFSGYVTLVLRNVNGANVDVAPSVVTGSVLERKTFLRAEQIA